MSSGSVRGRYQMVQEVRGDGAGVRGVRKGAVRPEITLFL